MDAPSSADPTAKTPVPAVISRPGLWRAGGRGERPAIGGIAVPGMPMGSPGMEQLGGKWEPYEVYTFDGSGARSVYEVRTPGP